MSPQQEIMLEPSVSDVIRRVIFNQRKQDIIKAHEDSLYRQAVTEKKIVVNVN